MPKLDKYIQYQDIVKHIGIHRGDIVLISSDISDLMYTTSKNNEIFDVQLFIDSILNKVGPQGTILFPTYSWKFCKGETFDYVKTKSETGYLGQVALGRNDFKRTQHPIYSFAVWGKHQDYLVNLDNVSSFEEKSPFGFLNRNKAKEWFIDVDLSNSFTFAHYVEQMCKAPYRYEKMFNADYIDSNGLISNRGYSMYVRDLDLDVRNASSPLELDLEAKGIVKKDIINNIAFRLADLNASVEVIKDDIINNRSRKLCSYKGQ